MQVKHIVLTVLLTALLIGPSTFFVQRHSYDQQMLNVQSQFNQVVSMLPQPIPNQPGEYTATLLDGLDAKGQQKVRRAKLREEVAPKKSK